MTTRRLSPSETRIMELIPQSGRKISTKELADRFYRTRGYQPSHKQVVISGLVRSLVKKTARTRPRVKRSERKGPYPIEVWIEQ